MQVCKKCVMDTTAQEIVFDEDGVCNFCKDAKKMLDEHWFPNEIGLIKLQEVSSEIRSKCKTKDYDCIIGVSGGVDSCYLLHLAVDEMKLRPLVVHVDAGWNSEIAVANIEKMVNKLNIDLFTYVVDWPTIRELQVAYLESSLANQDVPQDHAFFAYLYKHAIANGIKYVLTGSNFSSESILPSSWGYDAMDSKQIRDIFKRFKPKKSLKKYPILSYLDYKIINPYVRQMKVIKPLNWIKYDKNKATEFLMREYGWKSYGGKHHESNWTKFFQAYYLPKKFGYDKRKAHLSSLIVSGQISREAAIKELAIPPFDEVEARRDFEYIAKKLNIKSEELERLMNLPNKSFEEYNNILAVDNFFRMIKKSFGKIF